MRRYTEAALLVFNSLLFLILVNLVLAVAFAIRDQWAQRGPIAKYGLQTVAQVYPGWAEAEIGRLLDETYQPLEFAPYTLFRESPRQGRYVNVDPSGFRRIRNQGPWPPDSSVLNIFVFGGSTTFGYGIEDEETIPSSLQESLRACAPEARVYNFGQGFYFSSQERILFEQLLASGHRPDIAVFIDGVNEFGAGPKDEPPFAPDVERMFTYHQRGQPKSILIERLAMTRLARAVGRKVAHRTGTGLTNDRTVGVGMARANDRSILEPILDRWAANKSLIEALAEHHSIETLFVWQPIPVYGYDLRNHPFHDPNSAPLALAGNGYRLMHERREAVPIGNTLWLDDLQRTEQRPLYVDALHYTADFSRRIAGEIASELVRRGVVCASVGAALPRPGHSKPLSSTP
jgi:hypothetical protein